MAKFYGDGVKTGKKGSSVFRVRFGETIESQYQPIVSNPSTPSQVANRSRLKLLSQLSAVMAPVIALRREGAVSPRNMFVKTNYGATSYTTDTASISLADVKLTRSVVSLPAVTATREGATLTVGLAQGISGLNRVVYSAFIKQTDGTLRYANSLVVSEPGDSAQWSGDITVGSSPAVVYAYGVRDNSEAARAIFSDMQVLTAETVAKVIVSRTLLETDVTLTETRGIEVPIS